MSTVAEAPSPVISATVSEMALKLPEKERLELAARLFESVPVADGREDGADEIAQADDDSHKALLARADVQEGIRRLEDLMSGRVKGLTEEEFEAALHESPLPYGIS